MDLTSLRYFVALARNLHFTKTAQELYISQQKSESAYKQTGNSLPYPIILQKTKASIDASGQSLV